jgi:predicted RNA methylase
MINDEQRHKWFRKHIYDAAPGRAVLDVGTGTGLLAAYALESGARSVYVNDWGTDLSKKVLTSIGYHDVNYINQDFLTLTSANFKEPVELIIAEQVGPGLFDQIQVDIWRNARKFSTINYTSIPDELAVDVYVFENNVTEYLDNNLIAYSDTLPKGFYEASRQFALKPLRIIENAVSVTPENCFNPIEFTLDLTEIQDCTIVFYNKLGYQGDFLLAMQSFTQPWRDAPRIFLNSADCVYKFLWSKINDWTGEWKYERV